MPEDALQRQNVAAIHHEVTREGVTEYVSELSPIQLSGCLIFKFYHYSPGGIIGR